MRHRTLPTLALLGAIAAAAALGTLACTPEAKHRVLTFFFDGVPPLHATPEPGGEPGTKATTAVAVARAPEPPPVTWPEHKPTLDKKLCGTCHDRTASFAIVKPLTELCVSCHEPTLREFPRMHGPVAFGDCAVCHTAHRSRYKHLLREEAPGLCFRCHDRTAEGAKPHPCPRPSDQAPCLTCHDAHGGTDVHFLLDRQSKGPRGSTPPEPPKREGS